MIINIGTTRGISAVATGMIRSSPKIRTAHIPLISTTDELNGGIASTTV